MAENPAPGLNAEVYGPPRYVPDTRTIKGKLEVQLGTQLEEERDALQTQRVRYLVYRGEDAAQVGAAIEDVYFPGRGTQPVDNPLTFVRGEMLYIDLARAERTNAGVDERMAMKLAPFRLRGQLERALGCSLHDVADNPDYWSFDISGLISAPDAMAKVGTDIQGRVMTFVFAERDVEQRQALLEPILAPAIETNPGSLATLVLRKTRTDERMSLLQRLNEQLEGADKQQLFPKVSSATGLADKLTIPLQRAVAREINNVFPPAELMRALPPEERKQLEARIYESIKLEDWTNTLTLQSMADQLVGDLCRRALDTFFTVRSGLVTFSVSEQKQGKRKDSTRDDGFTRLYIHKPSVNEAIIPDVKQAAQKLRNEPPALVADLIESTLAGKRSSLKGSHKAAKDLRVREQGQMQG